MYIFIIVFCSFLYAQLIDKPIAIVNGEPILLSEFSRIVTPIIKEYERITPKEKRSKENIREIKNKVLMQMINDKLLIQEAKRKGITVTKAEIQQGVEKIKARFRTERDFLLELKKENLSDEEFKQKTKEQIMAIKLINQEILSKIPPPSSEDARKLFDLVMKKIKGEEIENISKSEEESLEFLAKLIKRHFGELVKVRHILIVCKKNTSKEKTEIAKKKIEDIRKRIISGDDFEEIAKLYSEDPVSKLTGGLIGYIAKGDMDPEFESVAFSTRVGEISEVFRTKFGFHILKVEEKRAKRKISYEEIENDLKEILFQQAARESYRKYIQNLRSKANITIKEIR